MRKNNLPKIIYLIALLLTICCLNSIVLSLENIASANEKREAEKAWKALIKTKGGRDKLHSVTNMLTELDDDITKLDIFPTRNWIFTVFTFSVDYGAVSVCREDASIPTGECANKDGLLNLLPYNPNLYKGWAAYYRVPYLLETKWDKPEPQRVIHIKQNKKNFDVIETIFDNMRIDFVFEPEEMLVREVKFYDKGKLWQQYNLSNYTEVDGIKMPQSYAYGWSLDKFDALKHSFPIKFKFNVEYDPQLFERPLKATSSDAWKPQKSTN